MSVVTLARPIVSDQVMWEELPFVRPMPINPDPWRSQIDFLSEEIIQMETTRAEESLQQSKSAFKVAQMANRLRIEKEHQEKEITVKNKRIIDLERDLANIVAEGVVLRDQLHNLDDQTVNQDTQIRALTHRLQRNQERTIQVEADLAAARNSVYDRAKLVDLVRENKTLSDAVGEQVALTAGCACCFTAISYFIFPPSIAFTFGGAPAILRLHSKEWAKVDARQKIVSAEIKEIENRILAEGFEVDVEVLAIQPEKED